MFELQVVGNVGNDPEMRYTVDGTPMTTFSVAADQGKDKPAQWVRVTCWRGLAEMVNTHLTKGQKVLVRGPLKVSVYEDKNKVWQAGLEIAADKFTFLSPKPKVDDELPPQHVPYKPPEPELVEKGAEYAG